MIFAMIMTLLTVWLFSACSANAMKDVSERRCGYYTGGDEVYSLVAVSGVREVNYVYDGQAGELVPYTLVTVSPKSTSAFAPDGIYTYIAEVENGGDRKKFGGALVPHPFAATYSAEFAFETMDSAFTVAVACGVERRSYTLTSQVSGDMLTYDRAISAARQELSVPEKCEVRAKLISDPVGDGLCWHIEFCGEDGEKCGVLLDATTARVIAKKSS